MLDFSKIETLRKEKKLSKQELADKIGVSKVTFWRYMKRKRMPSVEEFEKIATALGVSVAELLADEKENTEAVKVEQSDAVIIQLIAAENLRRQAAGEPPLKIGSLLSDAKADLTPQNASAATKEPSGNARRGSFTFIPVFTQATAASCGAGNGLEYADFEQEDQIAVDNKVLAYWDETRKPFGIHVEGDSMIGAGLYEGMIAVINPAEEVISGDAALVVWDGNWFIKWIMSKQDGSVELRSANPNYAPIHIDAEYAADPNYFRVIGKVVQTQNTGKPRRAF